MKTLAVRIFQAVPSHQSGVGFLGVDGFKYAVPLLVAGHEVVLHHLLGLEIGVFPDKASHDERHEDERGERYEVRGMCSNNKPHH